MAKLSVSKYDKFRTCPRLYFFEHVLYLERVRQEGSRAYGSLFHKGLETWWPMMGWGDNPPPWINTNGALDSALKAIHANAKHIDTDAYEVVRAVAMMTAYHVRWEENEYKLEADGVEKWFEVPLRDPDGMIVPRWMLNGRKDALGRFSGIPRVIEHKTTASEIGAGSVYFEKLTTALQLSAYIDAANQYLGEPVDGALYDVSRKPDLAPYRATPEAEREYTKGKGCATCGGTRSGDIKPGSGVVLIETKKTKKGTEKFTPAERGEGNAIPPNARECPDCKGTGIDEPPRLYAKHHDKDEPLEDYGNRVLMELTRAPDAYFWQGVVRRSEHELLEARADMVAMAMEVDHAFTRMRTMDDARARHAWPRNHNACQHQYGRRCDFYEVCTTNVDPLATPLYRIKERPKAVTP
jgi:hypothetical protein